MTNVTESKLLSVRREIGLTFVAIIIFMVAIIIWTSQLEGRINDLEHKVTKIERSYHGR